MDTKPGVSRKHFIDNARSIMILIVIVYHVFYLFNSVGVPKNITETGIPALDGVCYFLYPWLLTTLFLLAGLSARYALQKRGGRQFLKERTEKLLLPLAGGMAVLGWINIRVTAHYSDVFLNGYPPVVIAGYWVFLSIGPLWFVLELFILSFCFIVIRKVIRKVIRWAAQKTGKKGRPGELADRIPVFALLLFALPFWGSSLVFNTPLLIQFRNGIYLFSFLAGYYLFSREKIMDAAVRCRFPLLAAGILLGCLEVYLFYGEDYSAGAYLKNPLVNLYAWIMMLALLGMSKKYLNHTNTFMDYLRSRGFLWYAAHFPIMLFLAYFLTSKYNFPLMANYILLLFLSAAATLLFCEIARLTPVVRYLLFGIRGKNRT
jgi:hypothetical protein